MRCQSENRYLRHAGSNGVFLRNAWSALVLSSAFFGGASVVFAAENSADNTSGKDSEVMVWVDDAPLSLVVKQLAAISGREVEATSALEGQISGRYTGSMDQALSSISENHDVLFDLQDGKLSALTEKDLSKVSIALTGMPIKQEFKDSVLADTLPGNSVDFQDDVVLVSGHPRYVKRMAMSITREIASSGSRDSAIVESRLNPIVDPVIGSTEEEVLTTDSAVASAEESEMLQEADPVALSDMGSKEMLQNIQDETKPDSDRAILSKPIRWVTDIPGFDTF